MTLNKSKKRICEVWGEGSGLDLWITDCNKNNYADAGDQNYITCSFNPTKRGGLLNSPLNKIAISALFLGPMSPKKLTFPINLIGLMFININMFLINL